MHCSFWDVSAVEGTSFLIAESVNESSVALELILSEEEVSSEVRGVLHDQLAFTVRHVLSEMALVSLSLDAEEKTLSIRHDELAFALALTSCKLTLVVLTVRERHLAESMRKALVPKTFVS